ncbi:MAG: hypothetical protein ACE5Q6_00775 [Dehalococcoidia bacterium]
MGTSANVPYSTLSFRIDGYTYELSSQDIYDTARRLTDWGNIRKHYTILPDSHGRERRIPIRSLVIASLQSKYPNRVFAKGLSTVTLNRILTTLNIPIYTLS